MKKQLFLTQSILIKVFVTFIMVCNFSNAQTISFKRAHTLAADNEYALISNGPVHIGPSDISHSFSSAESLEDIYLFVEEGIATENMVYIFKEDWDEWPDFVFEKNYNLLSLKDLEAYIKEHKHLPGVISQAEVKEKGVNDKQMNITLLKKIEELTLYTIEQENALLEHKKLNEDLTKRLETLEQLVIELSKKL